MGVCLASLPVPARAQRADEVELGNRLAAVLRAGRTVVSNNHDLINDPAAGDMNPTGDAFQSRVIEAYLDQNREPSLVEGLSPVARRLACAQMAAMVEVMDESQDVINADGLPFKGFIPTVFARLVNERFAEKAAAEAAVKVTAAKHLVRNRLAWPDTWENQIIKGKFVMQARSEIVHNGATVKDAEVIKAQAAFALCFQDIADRLANPGRSLDEATNRGPSSNWITNVKFGSDLLFSAPAKKARSRDNLDPNAGWPMEDRTDILATRGS